MVIPHVLWGGQVPAIVFIEGLQLVECSYNSAQAHRAQAPDEPSMGLHEKSAIH